MTLGEGCFMIKNIIHSKLFKSKIKLEIPNNNKRSKRNRRIPYLRNQNFDIDIPQIYNKKEDKLFI